MASKKLKFLKKTKPAVTTPVQVFSPKVGEQPVVTQMIVTNLTSKTVQFSLFFDPEGSTFDETTALIWLANLDAGTADFIELNIPMNSSSGNIAVSTNEPDGINFTIFGLE